MFVSVERFGTVLSLRKFKKLLQAAFFIGAGGDEKQDYFFKWPYV